MIFSTGEIGGSISVASLILFAVLGLMGIGFYALLVSRNLIKVLVGLQVLGKGALLALVMAGYVRGQVNLAQSLALTVIVADTIVAVVGMALAVQIRHHLGTLDIHAIAKMKK